MSALLLVDIQNDFLPPNGSLAVPTGDLIVPAVLRLLDLPFNLIAASQDYHPRGHVSFASSHPDSRPFESITVTHPVTGVEYRQDLWPDHCVQGTHGADFEQRIAAKLQTCGADGKVFFVRKGEDVQLDAYSAFAKPLALLRTERHHECDAEIPSPLTQRLRESRTRRLVVAGLATDYCVRASVLSALAEAEKLPVAERWTVCVVREAVKGVHPDREEATLAELEERGVRIVSVDELEHTAIEAVIGALYHLQSPAGQYASRYYSLIFRDLPDRREYPDYYLFIKEPRSLNDIMESLRQGRYSSPQGVAYDLLLIWSNAREYNQQGSQVYADADTLEQYMARVWRERSPPLPPFESLPRPGSLPIGTPSLPVVPPPAADPERKVKRLKLTGASLGSSATKIRLGGPAAPPTPTPSVAATPPITLKLGGRTASSNVAPSTPSADLPALPPHLPTLPVPAPVASTSAHVSADIDTPRAGGDERAGSVAPPKKKKMKQSVDPEGDGEGEELQSVPQMPTVPDPEAGWMGADSGPNATARYLDIVNKIRNHTAADGRQLAVPLLDLPDRASRPDYYGIVKDPVALSTIEAKIRQGAYRDPEAFDRDLAHLFEVAKFFIRPETPGTLYGDLVTLQRLYQELTKWGSEGDFDLNALASVSVPGNIKREEGVSGEGETKVGRPTTRPTLKDKVLLDSINFKGDVLQVGDWIYLNNSQTPGKPIIAQIWQTYKKPDSPQRCLSVCWYYRPEETVHPSARSFYENEVFKSGIFIDHHVEEYIGRCFVMFFTKYTRGRPRPPAWTPQIPLYVCEYRYKDEGHSFKKIKSWVSCVPEQVRQHEYDFEPYADDHVDVLVRVRAPSAQTKSANAGPDNNHTFSQDVMATTAAEEAEPADQTMDLDVQTLDTLDLSTSFAAAPTAPIGNAVDPSLANFDASLLAAPSPAYLAQSTPTPAELDTTDFFTPLPSALKSKFRNDALGDLLWFGAPAASPPIVTKPTHSLAYLYWRVQKEQTASGV